MKKIAIGLSLVSVVAALAVAGLLPAQGGAVYESLAGGRDVLGGGLGKPDTWSFLTGGRVWVTASWGSNLLFQAVHAAAGDAGLLVFRFLLLGGIVAGIAVLARKRGAGAEAGLLAGAAALAAFPGGLPLGPRLVGFLCIPLVLIALHGSAERRRRLVIAGLLVAVWAHLHVSYLLGVAVLILWAVAAVIRRGFRGPAGAWPETATAVGAAVAACAVGPFGVQNLLRPLQTAQNPAWREILGWRPLLEGDAPRPWVFLVLAGIVVVGGAVRVLFGLLRRRPSGDGGASRGAGLFEGLSALLALALPFAAREFIPVSAILLAPTAARLLSGIDRRGILAAAASVGLAAALGTGYAWMTHYYDPQNPLRPRESLLGRSLERGTLLPVGVGRFLGENAATGNIYRRIYHPPEWEGYLRWAAPGLFLFTGERSWEIYDPATLDRAKAVLTATEPAALLREMDVHLVAVPLDIDYAMFCQRLLAGDAASWVYVYCDQRAAVLADLGDPGAKVLVDRTVAGTLQYPDPATAALSRAMCLGSTALGVSGQMAVTALERAVSLRPTDFAYALLYHRARQGGVDRASLIRYLEDQQAALNALDAEAADGIQILRSRVSVTVFLRRLYDRGTQLEKWEAANAASTAAVDRIQALEDAPWAVGRLRRLDLR